LIPFGSSFLFDILIDWMVEENNQGQSGEVDNNVNPEDPAPRSMGNKSVSCIELMRGVLTGLEQEDALTNQSTCKTEGANRRLKCTNCQWPPFSRHNLPNAGPRNLMTSGTDTNQDCTSNNGIDVFPDRTHNVAYTCNKITRDEYISPAEDITKATNERR
jgi:hypothetical protein